MLLNNYRDINIKAMGIWYISDNLHMSDGLGKVLDDLGKASDGFGNVLDINFR